MVVENRSQKAAKNHRLRKTALRGKRGGKKKHSRGRGPRTQEKRGISRPSKKQELSKWVVSVGGTRINKKKTNREGKFPSKFRPGGGSPTQGEGGKRYRSEKSNEEKMEAEPLAPGRKEF